MSTGLLATAEEYQEDLRLAHPALHPLEVAVVRLLPVVVPHPTSQSLEPNTQDVGLVAAGSLVVADKEVELLAFTHWQKGTCQMMLGRRIPDLFHLVVNEAREKAEKKRWREFAEKFEQGFFGFSEATPNQDNDYSYCVFGLMRSASDEDMKKAYRKSVLKAHPDKGGTPELFRKVREAWEYFKKMI